MFFHVQAHVRDHVQNNQKSSNLKKIHLKTRFAHGLHMVYRVQPCTDHVFTMFFHVQAHIRDWVQNQQNRVI